MKHSHLHWTSVATISDDHHHHHHHHPSLKGQQTPCFSLLPISPLPPSSRVISKLFLRGFSGLRTTVSPGWAARRADFTSSALRPYTRQLLLPEITDQPSGGHLCQLLKLSMRSLAAFHKANMYIFSSQLTFKKAAHKSASEIIINSTLYEFMINSTLYYNTKHFVCP